jgi:hypothetical protein
MFEHNLWLISNIIRPFYVDPNYDRMISGDWGISAARVAG